MPKAAPPPSLDDIIKEEKLNLVELKRRYFNACTIIPEDMGEYDLMRRSYDSVGEATVNDFRVMLGYITNPTADADDTARYIAEIPLLLDCLADDGKDVEYLRIAYSMALKHRQDYYGKK